MADLANLKSTMDRLLAEQAHFFAVQCEGARDWSPMDAKVSAAISAYVDAKFMAEWTPEVFAQRRDAWNAWVRATAKNGKIAQVKISAQEAAQGWRLHDLASAKLKLATI